MAFLKCDEIAAWTWKNSMASTKNRVMREVWALYGQSGLSGLIRRQRELLRKTHRTTVEMAEVYALRLSVIPALSRLGDTA
jgi:hypothetical protein